MEMIDVIKRLQEIAQTKPELVKDAVDNVERINPKEVEVNSVQSDVAPKTNEGGMSDIHIGAQEIVGEYIDDNGNLKMRKAEVLGAMDKEKANAPFPRSYEIETAMKMVQDDFNDNGSRKHEIDEPEGIDGLGDSEQLNTNTMKTEDKKPVNEAVQITTDSPEEAGMMMQILKLAGMQPMGAEMPSMDPGEHNKQMDVPNHETDGDEMASYRDIITKPDEEKAEENFANSEKESERDLPQTKDIETLVNVHSGGLNRQKNQYRKEYPGDNPMAAEDKVTEEDLANSLRAQYEGFKKEYQEAAKIAETKAKPDYIDIDKDGNKKEPMKKAVKDKEAK